MRWVVVCVHTLTMSAAAATALALSSSSSSTSSSSISSSTVIVGLNAALQKRLLLSDNNDNDAVLTPGRVHRAERVTCGMGGKGQDVAYTLHCLQYYHPENNDDNDHEIEIDPSSSSFSPFSPPCRRHHHTLRLAQFLGRGAAGDEVHSLWQTLFTTTSDEMTTTTTNENDPTTSRRRRQRQQRWLDVDDSVTIRTAGPLRTCTSVVTATATTELIEPSSVVSEAEWAELITALSRRRRSIPTTTTTSVTTATTATAATATAAATVVAIMGSMPPGCPPDAYAQIFQNVRNNEKDDHDHDHDAPVGGGASLTTTTLCLIDSVVGLETLLPTIAKTKDATRCLLKINVEELCRLVGLESSSDKHGAPPQPPPPPLEVILPQAIALLVQKYQLEPMMVASSRLAVALTNGRQPAYLALYDQEPHSENVVDEWTLYQLPVATMQLETMPLSDQQELSSSSSLSRGGVVLYPIGAGDAVAAGTLAAWHYLHNTTHNVHSLPRRVRSALDQRVVTTTTTTTTTRTEHDVSDPNAKILLVAVAFGLACGSASCLHEENSKVHIPHVLHLFDTTPLPTRLRTIPMAAAAAAAASTTTTR
jgi:hypothetical protein